jgi:hypothetical protein
MKIKLIMLLSFSLVLFINVPLTAQRDSIKKPDYYKVSKVKIFINGFSDIQELRKLGIGKEHIKVSEDYFEAFLDSFQLDGLKKTGYQFEIIIEDVTKDYLERTRESREKLKLNKPCKKPGFGYGSMGGFYTLDEVIAQLDSMHLLYQNLITQKDSIGSSIEGRPIWAVKISDNPEINEEEPEVFYNSLTHAREPAAMMAVVYFMYYLLENYGVDPEVTYLVNNREFYFVPVINPDGYVYNQQISPNGGGMWRKNMRSDSVGLFGVDLNRNYSYMWGYDNIGSSPIKLAEDYRGTAAFSEPETQAIRDFCISHNFLICNNYHTYGSVAFPPWGYKKSHTPDSAKYNCLIKLATNFNGYLNGLFLPTGHSLNYTTNGDVCDWMYGETNVKNKIIAVLTEVGRDTDGFWPFPERIFPLAEENLYANLIYAWGVGVIDNPPYISDAALNLSYCRPLIDTVKLTAIENNPENHTSNVFAKILTSNDSLINEIKLDQLDTSFTASIFLNTAKEEFYKILLHQEGQDIPSRIFFGNSLRFTTAGPVIFDSISIRKQFTNYAVRAFVHNIGNTLTITKASLKLICTDPWVKSIGNSVAPLPDLTPNTSTGMSTWCSVSYMDSIFPRYFNFKVEVRSDNFAYWTDSIRVNVLTGIEEEETFLTAFRLEQNYPNPFNPTTKISWQSPVSSRQVLKVYDVLGNEIVTLVNEEIEAGYHAVDFDASSLPSGVYFYQMKAESFIQTRKMLLLR